MSRHLLRLCVLSGIAFTLTATAAVKNPVLYWNTQAVNATRLSRNPPPVAALHFASLYVSMFDTLNTFEGKYQGWLVNDPAPAGADRDAAVHSAAFTVLSALWADSANPRVLRSAYDEALADIPDGEAKTAGLAWGKRIAEAVMFERAMAEGTSVSIYQNIKSLDASGPYEVSISLTNPDPLFLGAIIAGFIYNFGNAVGFLQLTNLCLGSGL